MPRLPSKPTGTLEGWDRPNSVPPPGAENLPPRQPSFTPSQMRPTHRHHQHLPSLDEERSQLVPLSIHSHHPSRTQSQHSHHPSVHTSRHSQAEPLVPLSIHSHHPSRTHSQHSHHPSAHPSQALQPAFQRTHTGAPSLAEVRSRLQPEDSPEGEQLQPLSIHSSRHGSVHPSHHAQQQDYDEVEIAPRARDSQAHSCSHHSHSHRSRSHHSRSHHSHSRHSEMQPRASQMQMQTQGGQMGVREASILDDGSQNPAAAGGHGGYSRHESEGGYSGQEGYGHDEGEPGDFRAAIQLGGGKRFVVEVRKKGSKTSRFERR